MFFELVYDKSLAQASYVIGCQAGGVAAVIDPKRDVDTYLQIAKANNMKITHIFETHIHADFLSGARELAALTGAEMYLSDEGDENWKYEFPHNKIKGGDVVKLGNLNFEVIHTPGHTPESVSFLLTDKPASSKPVMLFTGDFVFVGDVGRPDLLEQAAGLKGTQDIGAAQMYDSLNEFAKLGDFIQVWPGHGAGSACGKALGAVPSTTVGYEKIRNWALQLLNDKVAFSKELLADQPEPPKYFAMMKKLNKVDRKLVTEVPQINNLSKADFDQVIASGAKVIDTRPWQDYAKGFLKGTLSITNNNSFSTWMGWYINYDESFYLIAEEAQIEDLTRKLMRIGLDNLAGYITPAQLEAFESGNLASFEPIDKAAVEAARAKGGTQIVDVRGAAEFKKGHIEGAENHFVGKLDKNLDKISKNKPVIIHCQSGARAAIAYSVLTANGFDNIQNYAGGWADYIG
ncbi:Zn-dependent hydrolase, glyoxylase [Belliella baltica DSM 15883]|uniref:Zn-dependent hydrolase, glyoxylase n=1 Tax=Belliella baltica (strain DSM 15883 / CIP 108006 / LMG 21964 / BA134) TaxID=866536 RepID=I3Z9I0_BELBD|nr:MBL fold metallo-hydrolase [Belliella baltica]AFL85898.1 Zn-dependent hydrolase, glyoxylase [Belliella baltica DSM 15883]